MEKNDNINISNKIRNILKQKGWSQEHFRKIELRKAYENCDPRIKSKLKIVENESDGALISKPYLSKLLNGEVKISDDYLTIFSLTLGVDEMYLMNPIPDEMIDEIIEQQAVAQERYHDVLKYLSDDSWGMTEWDSLISSILFLDDTSKNKILGYAKDLKELKILRMQKKNKRTKKDSNS